VAIEYYFDYNCIQSSYDTVDHYLYDPITDPSISECGHTVYKKGYYSELSFLIEHNRTVSDLQSIMYRIVNDITSIFNDSENTSSGFGWVDYQDGQGRQYNSFYINYNGYGYSYSFLGYIGTIKEAFKVNNFSPAVYNGEMNCLYIAGSQSSLSAAYANARMIANAIAQKKRKREKNKNFVVF